jgi:hypothetical protein
LLELEGADWRDKLISDRKAAGEDTLHRADGITHEHLDQAGANRLGNGDRPSTQHGATKPLILLRRQRITTPWVAGSNPAGIANDFNMMLVQTQKNRGALRI